MKLRDYLEARGETAYAFALRAQVGRESVYRIITDPTAGVHAGTADKIVRASEAQPAPDGGTVTLGDLIGKGAA